MERGVRGLDDPQPASPSQPQGMARSGVLLPLQQAFAARPRLLLLDDPFAELDARRATRILELIDTEGRGQTILAVPRASDIPDGLTRLARWRISAGALTREGA